MLSSLSFVAACLTVASATPWASPSPPGSPVPGPSDWDLKKFTSLVVFGDSYTDEDRAGYFSNHNGSAPPIGWVEPSSNDTSVGGRVWARYVSQYTSANLYNYAVSGAVCSNAITPRWFSSINANFPAVAEYEVPAFIADSHFIEPNGTRFLDVPADETVYAIWIGTNDLGNDAFLTDSQVPGKTLADYVDCVFGSLQRVYDNGGRYFVLMNAAPLQLLPQYRTPTEGGVVASQYFRDKATFNETAIMTRIAEEVDAVNGLMEYRAPVEMLLTKNFTGAHLALFSVHDLMEDIFYNPSQYLNGTAPLNVTSYINQCSANFTDCVRQPSPDSFEWFDELHPSEQTSRTIAAEFAKVAKGESAFADYYYAK